MENSDKIQDAAKIDPKEVANSSAQPQQAAVKQDEQAQPDCDKKPVKRTFGLKAFDFFLYPVVVNTAVFAISVAATYLTSRGGDRLPSGELQYGKIGQWFQKRGDWLTKKLESKGLSHDQADMGKMVALSFIDGSVMAPVVKVCEDHREQIGKKIDKAFHKYDEQDEAAYRAEPKQSWRSVGLGRVLTFGIVFPTAVALDKTGMNNKWFIEPGKKLGEKIARNPNIAKYFGKLDVKEISKITLFEGFYTSVCTAGLYLTSRFFARHDKKKHDHEQLASVKDKAVATGGENNSNQESETKWADKFRHSENSHEKTYVARVNSHNDMAPAL